jgi:hypothetical protein
MKRDKKSAIFLSCGFLTVMLGAMFLNGYVGFLLAPSDFHPNAFTGTIPHLLAGLIPWFVGVFLITFGSDRPLHVLPIYLAGLAGGFIINVASFINSGDRSAFIGWAVIVTFGVACAAAARTLRNVNRQSPPNKPQPQSGSY